MMSQRRFGGGRESRRCHLFLITCLFSLLLQFSMGMRVNPERMATRLRIEQEIARDHQLSRTRRQLGGGTPKEETIQVTAQLFSGRLFEYGVEEAGDKMLPSSMDVGKKLQLSRPLSFYGNQYNTVYILSNGGIGFESSSRTYRSNILPSNLKIIAPFWNRNDLRNGGSVFYREVTSGRVVERGQSEIRYQYDKEVKVLSAIIATWVKMQPLGTAALPEENTNTFQAAIFVTSNGTFANFIYSNIGWTQGAEAGFSRGDGSKHFALPTSGTGNIMYLEDYGNTGIPGEWMFVLDDDRVLRCKAGIKGDTCDEACGSGEWGPDCAGCCHCAGGVQCNNATGECSACANCWTGFNCQQKSSRCKNDLNKPCAHNAISFTDYDRCGEPTQRCECLAGYEGKGYEECKDVDECAQPGTCHERAVCTNTPGRFFCQCMEGFSGDGVAECIASFLYPHQGEKLPKSRNSKVAWQLKYPLKIFGKERDRITISTNGLIVVKELAKLNLKDQLDDMEILGIAPFFAPIDLASGNGEVLVSETTDSDVLTRTTLLINEHMPESAGEANFRATSVVIISFVNVTTAKSKNANTFQTLLIGGTNRQRENISFVEFLYKDLAWSDGAEAGIMTIDKTNSIHLPGSGTAGIEQLSQLSNIRLPGIWLYRVDGDIVLPCMQMDLQPPYCDAQSPTLIGHRRPSASTLPATTPHTTTITTTTQPTFQHIQAEVEEGPAPFKSNHKIKAATQSGQSSSNEITHKPNRRPTQSSTTSQTPVAHPHHKFTPAFAQVESRTMAPIFMPGSEAPAKSLETSTQRRPIVALNSKEIEELPPDAFDITFPPTLSMVPKLFPVIRPAEERQPISFIQPELVTPSPSRESWATEASPSSAASTPELPKEAFPAPPTKQELPPKPRMEFDWDGTEKVVEVDDSIRTIVPSVQPTSSSTIEETPAPSTTPKATSSRPEHQQTTTESSEEQEQETPSSTSSTPNNKLFVFTTTKTQKVMSNKPKVVVTSSSHPPKFIKDNSIEDDSVDMPFDANRVLDAEAPGSKLFVVITISIVAVWLVILLIVAGFICCQRRSSQLTLRTMYAPACQIRPFPNGKHYAEGHYEDHIDKVNRLKTEQMNALYNQQAGRMSLYGSYWNISPRSSGQPSTPPMATGLINRSEAASAIAFNSHLLTTNSTNPSQRSPTYLPFSTQRYTHAARH